MNDFTKEELELLQELIWECLRNTPCPIEIEYLAEKVGAILERGNNKP